MPFCQVNDRRIEIKGAGGDGERAGNERKTAAGEIGNGFGTNAKRTADGERAARRY